MAALGSQSIASSYEQLLHVDADGGGNSTTHVSVKDGDNGTTFGFTIASDALMMSSTNRLEFGDDGTYIHQSADGVLDLVSDTEIELNGTIDINGAVDMSSTLTLAGNADFNGDLDVAGTSNLDTVQIDGTLTVGVDGTGEDVKFFGDTASAYMLWDESADDLILAGAAGFSVGDNASNQGMTIASNGTITVLHDGNTNELVLRNADVTTEANNVMQIWDFSGDSDGTGAYYALMEDADGEIGSIKISSASGVAFNTSSDYRLKENEVLITDGLEMVNNLKPYRFNFKGHTDLTLDGFFAHEVAPFVPTAVDGEKDAMNEDGTIHPQSMDYSQMVTVMVAAIQELSAKVEALEG